VAGEQGQAGAAAAEGVTAANDGVPEMQLLEKALTLREYK
jgi:hypothetical protein